MSVRLRPLSILAGLVLAAIATAAAARDYVVVASTDPAVARGQSFAAGARIPLPAGKTVTLMHATGDIVRLKGADGGVVLPKRAASQGDADRLAILKVIVAPADRQVAGGLALRKTRSGVCPAPDKIKTLDAIVQVYQAGCASSATDALNAWITAHPPSEEAPA
jgi:hypothetical protein